MRKIEPKNVLVRWGCRVFRNCCSLWRQRGATSGLNNWWMENELQGPGNWTNNIPALTPEFKTKDKPGSKEDDIWKPEWQTGKVVSLIQHVPTFTNWDAAVLQNAPIWYFRYPISPYTCYTMIANLIDDNVSKKKNISSGKIIITRWWIASTSSWKPGTVVTTVTVLSFPIGDGVYDPVFFRGKI